MLLHTVLSVLIVLVWILMWPAAIIHGKMMERPDTQGWSEG